MNSTLEQKTFVAIGIMSGTSLDGIDLAACRFTQTAQSWQFQLLAAETLAYPAHWHKRLATVENTDAASYAFTHIELGHYMGELTRQFIDKWQLRPDFVASHGHTIFHQPARRFTAQIGCGAALSIAAGLPVVCDFRTADVALGGQGAPLVPVGDQFLFGEYACCVNLGGIANLSAEAEGRRIAFDICPANMLLNYLAAPQPYDEGGTIARSGQVNSALLEALNCLAFYRAPHPKSLGKEWFLAEVKPLFEQANCSRADKLHTAVIHIAMQLRHTIASLTIPQESVLITGGGAFNHFLIETLKQLVPDRAIIVPEPALINFKEAIVFALLGVLRWCGKINCLSSVTGAKADSCGGAIYWPQQG
jgi:anhydro-N-acetylmuramic acid kinase